MCIYETDILEKVILQVAEESFNRNDDYFLTPRRLFVKFLKSWFLNLQRYLSDAYEVRKRLAYAFF